MRGFFDALFDFLAATTISSPYFLLLIACVYALWNKYRNAVFPPYISVSLRTGPTPEKLGAETGRLEPSWLSKLLMRLFALLFGGLMAVTAIVWFPDPDSGIRPVLLLMIGAAAVYALFIHSSRRLIVYENGVAYFSGLKKSVYYFTDIQEIRPEFSQAGIRLLLYVLELRKGKRIYLWFGGMERLAGFLRYKNNPYITGYFFTRHPKYKHFR